MPNNNSNWPKFKPKYKFLEGKKLTLRSAHGLGWQKISSSKDVYFGYKKEAFNTQFTQMPSGFDDGQETAYFDKSEIKRAVEDAKQDDNTQSSKKNRFDTVKAKLHSIPAVFQSNDDGSKTQVFDSASTSEILVSDADQNSNSVFVDRKKPRSFVLGTFFTTLRVLAIVLLCVMVGGLGIAGGVVTAYTQTTPELDFSLIEDVEQASILYDSEGNEITTLINYQYSEWAPIDEIPDMLQNAFIAVEDVRFFEHSGIDIKRLAAAVIGTLTGDYDGGGSTITQQLIKIQVLGSEQSYRRKVQEAYLAMELENEYKKESILEAYLNSIHLGGVNYGVKAAAKDYFGKELDQLTIRECAMLAGLTQNPSRYNPRQNMYFREDDSFNVTDERTNTVLERMYSAGFISLEQRDAAKKDDVKVLKTSQVRQMYEMPYFVEYAVHDVVTHFLREKNLQDNKQNRASMEKELRTGGYSIYTTVKPQVQRVVQQIVTEWDRYPAIRDPSRSVKREMLNDGSFVDLPEPQASCVIIDQHTGHVLALVGGRPEPTQAKLWNRAYSSATEVGSAIKPLSIYGPALDSGASPASVYLNYTEPIEGYGGDKGYPSKGSSKEGPVTMRNGVINSMNIVAARALFESVGIDRSMQYLSNLGINSAKLNPDGPGLALGTSGITPLEMTAAYAAVANNGMYLQPVSFTKVLDKYGNTVIDSSEVQIKRQVFSPATAWLLTDMLEDAVESGTGTNAQISGMHVAGKTGTNSDYNSVCFGGYTPYYTSFLWIGHDDYSESTRLKSGASGGSYAAPLWQAYMSAIHIGMEDKKIINADPSNLGLVERETCSISGLLASSACRSDSSHKPVTDWYLLKDAPTEYCKMHRTRSVCNSSGKLASDYCPKSSIRRSSYVVLPSDSPYRDIPNRKLNIGTILSSSAASDSTSAPRGTAAYEYYYCQVHDPSRSSSSSSSGSSSSNSAYDKARSAISEARTLMASDAYITQSQRSEMTSLINSLESLVNNNGDEATVDSQVRRLREIVSAVRGQGVVYQPEDDEIEDVPQVDVIQQGVQQQPQSTQVPNSTPEPQPQATQKPTAQTKPTREGKVGTEAQPDDLQGFFNEYGDPIN